MNISTKLGLIYVVVAVAVIMALSVVVFVVIGMTVGNQIAAEETRSAHQTADDLGRFLMERRSDIQDLASKTDTFLALGGQTAATYQLLAGTSEAALSWESLALVDAHGTTIVELSGNTRKPLAGDPALSGQFEQAKIGPVYSDALLIGSTPQPVMVFMAPVNSGGHLRGVLVGQLTWARILTILHQIKSPASAQLVDRQGRVIGDNLTHATGQAWGQPYSASPRSTISVSASETADRPYADNGWRLFVATPTSIPYRQAVSPALLVVLSMTIAAGMAIAMTMAVLNWQVARPIKALNLAVARITVGDLRQTVTVWPHDELGTLGRNFNEMTRQLANTHRKLQASTHAAEERRAQLESSINGLHQGFIITDAGKSIVMANTAAHELIAGSEANESRPRLTLGGLAQLLPTSFRLDAEIRNTLQSQKPSKYSNLSINSKFVNLYLSPVLSGDKAIGCVVLLEDITDQRILDRSKDEFFSIASHELRTPLTAIKGNASLMLQYYPEATKNPDLKEMIEDIHTSSVRLIEIVNDFLDTSRIEQGKISFNLQHFPLDKVIEQIIYEMGSVLKQKHLYLNVQGSPLALGKLPLIYGDPDRTKQIIYNLVGNAIKFTEGGGITISASADEHFVKVRVADTGRGIPEETQNLLFRKFQQAGPSILTRDTTRGTGLGLYISKLLTEKMGGEIGLEQSAPGQGTTFFFTLPLHESTRSEPKTSA